MAQRESGKSLREGDLGIEVPMGTGGGRGPSLTARLYRRSVFYIAGLFLLAIPAFWPTYLNPPKVEADWHVHVHGIAMFLWFALLITQSSLIRSNNRALHRQIGKLSYALVPVIVASTFLLANYRMRQGLNEELLYFFYLQVALMAVFVFAYSLAIRQRRSPAMHARYMVCTALAVLDPIVARILFNGLGTDYPYAQLATFGIVDAILLWLMLRDRREGNGLEVFPTMLGAFVAIQVPTFFLYKTPAWRAFTEGFAALPLP
jgi:uncharacterized membrane protein